MPAPAAAGFESNINIMKKILLIEDNNNIRENTAEIMELANYRVFTAANGKEGVETALRENPDLIICDIMMAGTGRLWCFTHAAQKHPHQEYALYISNC